MALTKEQLLLTKIAEEATELAKEALKVQQFGREEICPGATSSNQERMAKNLFDLLAVLDMWESETGIFLSRLIPNIDAHLVRKEFSVEEQAKYSVRLGMVEDEN